MMLKRKTLCLILALSMIFSILPAFAIVGLAADEVGIISAEGWLESAYVEWSPIEGAEGYTVYVAADGGSYSRIDDQLIRRYKDNMRADALGLKAGSYKFKVVPIKGGAEDSSAALVTDSLTVLAHDRSGFGFVNGSSSGAYNDDGTLKNGAVVIYVTEATKNSVSATIDGSTYTGLANILSSRVIKRTSTPICVRFVGNITDLGSGAAFDKGDLLISEGRNITLEGVGEDSVLNGFGIRIKGSSNIEIRNLGIMNCNSDEGDNIGLQQDNDHIWVHNCDFFYGDAGSDADQAKGDGALDTKKTTYVTHSYNHFFDCGKVNLQGNTGEETTNYITYHHNWYDHTDSRHPRVRTGTIHVYNNLYDGISKYGIGAAMGCSIFSEANYFLNSKKPFLASAQGSDTYNTLSGEDGGIIKSFGDVFVNSDKPISYADNNRSFDAYFASTRDEQVPDSVVALKGGSKYNNFDTSSIMYDYEAESAADAMASVKKYAGRMNGGDFKWSFTTADNTSYDVNSALKSALVNYKTSIISIGGYTGEIGGDQGGDNPGTPDTPDNPDNPDNPGGDENDKPGSDVVLPVGSYTHNVTESDLNSSFFALSGSMSDSKGTVNYAGLSLTKCLKLSSKASVRFTAPADGRVTLVFNSSNAGYTLKINGGSAVSIPSDGIYSFDVEAGQSYEVLKGSGESFLYYLVYTPSAPEHQHEYIPSVAADPTCSESGEIIFACQCGDSYSEAIAPLGHSFTDGSCILCGAADPDYKPEDDPTDDPVDDPTDDPTDDPVDDPTDDPVDDPTDDPIEEPDEPCGGVDNRNIFQIIWDAIVNFFKMLFGIKD